MPIFFVITKTPPLILYLYVFYYYGKNIAKIIAYFLEVKKV